MGILPIGFFAPLPLAIMIPFMAAQSFAMGHAFGTSFQYGKRKISSMTNEEFNALSATDLHGQLQADIRAMIPDMNQSFKQMERFQIDIINSMVNTLRIAAQDFAEWLAAGGPFQTSGAGVQSGESNVDYQTLVNDQGQTEILPVRRGGQGEGSLSPFQQDVVRTKRQRTTDKIAAIRARGSATSRTGVIVKTTARDLALAKNFEAEKLKLETIKGMFIPILKFVHLMKTSRNQSALLGYARKFLIVAKRYNRYVQSIRRSDLTINTTRTIQSKKVILSR